MLNPSLLAKKQIVIHLVNLLSNLLSTDSWSCRLRRKLLSLLGNRFGEGTVVWGGSYFGGGKLTTGSACFINRSCHFDFNESITLGRNVVVGHHVTFITAEHQIGDATRRAGPLLGKPIAIGDAAWIGANVTILPGVVIGSGAVVGAGAVVTKDVPPDVVVAGVPAKVLRKLETAQSLEPTAKELVRGEVAV
jgi:maltose O-acetyltransferase